MGATITIGAESLGLSSLRNIWDGASLAVDANVWQGVDDSHAAVTEIIQSGKTVYGINTGFGLLADKRIAHDDLVELQTNLVRSHAAGVGQPMEAAVVRLMMALKVISLSRGHSGVRRQVIDLLLALANEDALPVVPIQGSVGASGDLAPLAHMSLALIGEGHVQHNGETKPAAQALKELGLEPIELGPKEGLALLNGTQTSTALALDAFFRLEHLWRCALVTGAMSVDALHGSDTPFDDRIHNVRGHSGQIQSAQILRDLLKDSEIRASHATCDKVQDPYSLRCQPQVMGAIYDNLVHIGNILAVEANGVTDNPLIFTEPNESLSGGNFHAAPVGFAADLLAIVGAEIGALSERRMAVLTDPKMSGLPAFLVKDSGLNSGFMIAQVTAAALVSENKTLAHPASVDSIPTSAGQEDHVSMAPWASRKARRIADNVTSILAIEALAAAQGLDFHAPLKTSSALLKAHDMIRQAVPHWDKDRNMANDVAAAQTVISSPSFAGHAMAKPIFEN